jgi:glycerol-3-phosphate dehydrogenase
MAKKAVEKAAEVTGLELMPAPVEEAPLPGGDFDGSLERLEKGLVVDSGVSPVCAARLVRLYGTEAREVVRSGVEPLVPDAPVLAAEVAWAVQVEAAATVEDVVYRRLRTAFYTENTREASIVPVADAMAKLLGWTEERKRREVAGVRARLAEDLSFLNN